jgi:cell division transport system permease protein
MKLDRAVQRLRFFVADAWDEWRHSLGVNLLATVTLSVALSLAGLVLLVLSNLERRLELEREDVRVHVFLRDDLGPGALEALADELGAMPGVARVDHVDRQEALRRYREWAGSLAALADELETNPLPASLEVSLLPGPQAQAQGEAILAAVRDHPAVEDGRFDREWLAKLEALLELARLGGGGLGIVAFGAVIFVMASVLRLAVHARRDEIEIMLLVGATPAFVRGPFLVAGLGQGILASALALGIVEGARLWTLGHGEADAVALVQLIVERPLPALPSALMLLAGLAVSLTSAFFAVRASL